MVTCSNKLDKVAPYMWVVHPTSTDRPNHNNRWANMCFPSTVCELESHTYVMYAASLNLLIIGVRFQPVSGYHITHTHRCKQVYRDCPMFGT